MPVHVLHVIPAVAPRYGGPSQVALETVKWLQTRGDDALIATTDADGAGRLDVETGRPTRFDEAPVIFFRRDASEAFKWSRGLAAWLHAHVADFDLVDIHAIFSHSSLAAARACARERVPYVVRPHGALNPWGLAHKRWQKQLLFAAGARRMLGQAGAVVYTSRREQELAERAFSWLAHGVVVPPGIDGPASVAGGATPPAVESPYVLVLSRLVASKRIDVIIRAFHHIVDLIPDRPWRLVITGDGDPAVVETLRQEAAAGPAAAQIEFRGWVTGGQKQALLAGASLLAAPSHQESFGLSLVEAMSCGVPVLTSTDVDLAADIEEAGAGWVVPADVQAMAQVLGDVLSRPEDRHSRGAAARELAAGYDWPASIRRLQDVYGLVLDRVVEPLPGVVPS